MANADPPIPSTAERSQFWRYARVLAAPLLLWVLVVIALREPLQTWLHVEESYDRAALQEWLEEARGFRQTLPEMVEDYLARTRLYTDLRRQPTPTDPKEAGRLATAQQLAARDVLVKKDEIYEHLKTLGVPPTKRYAGQLPLFPIIYRLQVRFHLEGSPLADLTSASVSGSSSPLNAPITWDSGLPSDASQYQDLEHRLHPYATVYIRYQLHAYNKRQRIEQAHHQRLRQLSAFAVAGTVLGLTWMVIVQRRERERDKQRLQARQKVDRTERLLLQEERRHADTERQLLEQRLATQAAERQALELKSQMWASIGIMAGSYAHNIKNLLVRPNDLLRRCMEAAGVPADQEMMLGEIQQTLGTVTERLQQILHTVRRDPSHTQATVLDLNAVVSELEHTWKDLAREKWKLELVLELNAHRVGQATAEDSLWIAGDVSHLQQAIENLLFNARDATFEMRNHLRDTARQEENLDGASRRQALIAAAAWKGRVLLRTFRCERDVVLEVCDNGAGMTEEVRQRCTETHFSTKRDNAIYEGHSTGMGLGLSFVVAILEHHHARLEIDSGPLKGTTFRMRFPATTGEATASESAEANSEGRSR
ncbi:MAG TPA: HAMP domain-containing sensor histidine kinase [Gemmataceae bacterium]|nr:HAMP domain-containing sensor histidine kinase [Gemmataceae bacterium]